MTPKITIASCNQILADRHNNVTFDRPRAVDIYALSFVFPSVGVSGRHNECAKWRVTLKRWSDYFRAGWRCWREGDVSLSVNSPHVCLSVCLSGQPSRVHDVRSPLLTDVLTNWLLRVGPSQLLSPSQRQVKTLHAITHISRQWCRPTKVLLLRTYLLPTDILFIYLFIYSSIHRPTAWLWL